MSKFNEIYTSMINEDVSLEDLAGIVESKLKTLGFKPPILPKIYKGMTSSKMSTIMKEKIDPKTLGLLGPIFEKVNVEISVGASIEHGLAVLILEYSWDHKNNSGSNGYTLRMEYANGEWQ